MKNRFSIIVIILWLPLFFVHTNVFGQDSTWNNYSGSWSDNASWVSGSSPGFSVDHIPLDIYGYITLSGNVSFNNGLLHIHDTLIVNGDFALLNNGDLTIDEDGIFIVFGDYISYNQVQVSCGGYFIVTGNFEMQGAGNQGSFDNNGAVYIFDDSPEIKNGDGYNDLACPDSSNYPDSCGFGNDLDIINDPIFDFFDNTECCLTDVTNPTLSLPAISAVQCNSDIPVPYADYAALVAAGGSASDNCGINISSFTLENETSMPSGNATIIIRTYRISDNCNRSISEDQAIIILDSIAPVITCPSNIVQCASDNVGAVINGIGLVSITDNCTLPENLNIQYSITGKTIKSGMLDASGTFFNNGLSAVEYTVTDENGNETACNFIIKINAIPVTSEISGDITPDCNASNVNYSVTNTPGSKYHWTVPVDASIISDTSGLEKSSIVVNFGKLSGIITVRETNSSNCSGDIRSLDINLQHCAVSYDFESDKTEICLGDSIRVWNTSSGISASATYEWNFGNSAMPASAIGPGPHNVHYSNSGTKTLTLTVIDGTSNIVTKDILVHDLPEISLTCTDRCGAGSVLFTATPVNANSVDFSTDSGLTVIRSDDGSPYEYPYYLNDSESVTVWARANNTITGCVSGWSEGVEVTAMPLPVTGSINADSPSHSGDQGTYLDIACKNERRIYSVTPVSASTYRWRIPALNIDEQGIISIEAIWNLPQGEYTISLQEISSQQCNGSICEEKVFVTDPSVDLGPDQEICAGESHVFEPSGNYSGYTWHNSSHGNSYTGTITETIWVNVSDQYGCETSDTVELLVHPAPQLNLGNDTMICADSGYKIMVPGFTAYHWSTGESTGSIVVYSGNGLITLMVTDEHSCTATDTIIILECTGNRLFDDITNTFTPNGDGIHDVWMINNIELYPNAVIDVYDRGGRLVFHTEGYKNDWNGTYKGKPLPVDTYFYVIDFKSDEIKPKHGTITIIR